MNHVTALDYWVSLHEPCHNSRLWGSVYMYHVIAIDYRVTIHEPCHCSIL